MEVILACLTLACCAGLGVQRLIRQDLSRLRYLREAESEEPMETGHLSPLWRGFAQQTRILRMSLEGTSRQLDAATPVSRNGLLELLVETNRMVDEWLKNAGETLRSEAREVPAVHHSFLQVRQAHQAGEWGMYGQYVSPREVLLRRLSDVRRELHAVERELSAMRMPYR